MDIGFGRSCDMFMATDALDGGIDIIRMNFWFHIKAQKIPKTWRQLIFIQAATILGPFRA